MLWFKILNKSGKACNGGKYVYDLPKNGKPGAWTTHITKPIMCQSGYHVTVADCLDVWCGLLAKRRLFIAQVRGVKGDWTKDDKIVCRQIRLVREIRISPDKRRCVQQAFVKAQHEAQKRWDWDGTRISQQARARRLRLMGNYIERKMGWRKD